MDPLTIATAAATLAKSSWSIGQSLYVFSHDVSNIDRTVIGLATEVKTLSGACALVEERLQGIVAEHDPVGRPPASGLDKIWTYLQGLVQDTQTTIEQLDGATRGARREGSTLPSKMWRQFQLDMNAKDITEARDRIRSHTASLHIALQTLTIEVLYLQPHKADQGLQSQLSYLLEGMEHLKSLSAERTTTTAERQTREEEILAIGRATVSRGDSLYTASIGVSSLLGDYRTSGRAPRTNDWVQDLQEIDNVAYASIAMAPDLSTESSTDDSPSAIFDVSSNRPSTALTDYTGAGIGQGDVLEEADYDSDDEFSIEAARAALDEGRSSFHSEDYDEATSFLKEALKMVRELPPKRQNICDTWEIRHMLSICAFHTQDPAEAKSVLLALVDFASRSADPKQLEQACDASHLLAIVCVRLGDLEEARLHGVNALKVRRRLFGKAHKKSYLSRALMAKLTELSGNAARATIYLQMIPADERATAVDEIEQLALKVVTRPQSFRGSAEAAELQGEGIAIVKSMDAPGAAELDASVRSLLHIQHDPASCHDSIPRDLRAHEASMLPLPLRIGRHHLGTKVSYQDFPPSSNTVIAELDAMQPESRPRKESESARSTTCSIEQPDSQLAQDGLRPLASAPPSLPPSRPPPAIPSCAGAESPSGPEGSPRPPSPPRHHYRRRHIEEWAEEDECPVCGEELPAGEATRERHVEECIATQMAALSAPPPPLPTRPQRASAPELPRYINDEAHSEPRVTGGSSPLLAAITKTTDKGIKSFLNNVELMNDAIGFGRYRSTTSGNHAAGAKPGVEVKRFWTARRQQARCNSSPQVQVTGTVTIDEESDILPHPLPPRARTSQ